MSQRIKYTARLILVFFITAISLASCSEDNDINSNNLPDSKDVYTTTDCNIKALNEEFIGYIETISDDNTVVFRSGSPESIIPEIGDKLFIPISEKTPFGFMGKVKSVDRNGAIYVHTETMALDEIFPDLDIDSANGITESLIDVVDENGNPIDYELIDQKTHEVVGTRAGAASAADNTANFSLKDYFVRFPFKIYDNKDTDDDVKVKGSVYAGFKRLDIKVKNTGGKVENVNIDITPACGLNIQSEVTIAGKSHEIKDHFLGRLRYRVVIPTPWGIPIIMPISGYLYATVGYSGELTTTISLTPEYATSWNISYSDDQWSCRKVDYKSDSPLAVSEFEVKGEIYFGNKVGVIVGLYTQNLGVGINVIPKYSLSASASISTDNVLNLNPKVEESIKIGSEAYCVAKFFGKKLAKATFEFPEFTAFSRSKYLLPQFEDFKIKTNDENATISYRVRPDCFLSFLNLKTAATVFGNDMTTQVQSLPSSTGSKDSEGFYHTQVNTQKLEKGKTYYAAPSVIASRLTLHGSKKKFEIGLPPITGNWTTVWNTTPPNAQLLRMYVGRDGTLEQTYYYHHIGTTQSYSMTYTYNHPLFHMHKDNGDEQTWTVTRLTFDSLTLQATNGFKYSFTR